MGGLAAVGVLPMKCAAEAAVSSHVVTEPALMLMHASRCRDMQSGFLVDDCHLFSSEKQLIKSEF